MSDIRTKLARLLAGQSPNAPAARRIISNRTTRDADPLRGSEAVLRAIASGGAGRGTAVSMNVSHGDGTTGKAFLWDVPGFGWDEGEWI